MGISHQSLSDKYIVFNTLTNRTRNICVNLELLQEEEEHIKGALQRFRFPNWALTGLKIKNNPKYNVNYQNNKQQVNKTSIWWFPTPRGKVRVFKIFVGKMGIQVHCKGGNTMKNLLVAHKDKDITTKKRE